MPGWAMSWSPWLAVVAWVGCVLVTLAGSSCLGGLCLMMQRSWLEMLMLEKLPTLIVLWLGSSVEQRE